jgi:hypothetical protein
MTTNTQETETRRIQLYIDEETYQQFQTVKRQQSQPSDSAFAKHIVKHYLTTELDRVGTQKYYTTRLESHLFRSEWLTVLVIYLLASIQAKLTQEKVSDILEHAATKLSRAYKQVTTELTVYIDQTEKD